MPTKFVMRLLAGTALSALLASAAVAQARPFDIPEQDASLALQAFAMQSGMQVLFPYEATKGKRTPAINGDYSDADALAMLAQAAGLRVTADDGKTVTLKATNGPQSGSAAGDGAEVEALIVTAQKREEDIQDVPIAISAFTQEALEEQKIEGGFDLLKAIPNVTFSKNNFTSYNFSIRGIGTKAVSATTDPAVAVSFNNTALLQNRLFEQEYFDVERVEVLRGPQGTLYGRNATAGVINVISAKPDMDEFDGWVKGEVGNYHTKRVSAMVNVPLVEDKLAIRFAGALTDRQGYDYNSVTKHAVNGRDLWSTRLTLAFEPSERLRGNLIWERFEEDDNRSRTGKQLCHRDDGPSVVGNTPVTGGTASVQRLRQATFSQGCRPGSLYDDAAFGTPNGLALPFVYAMLVFGDELREPGEVPTGNLGLPFYPLGVDPDGIRRTLVRAVDPYGGAMQSRDLRTIASFRDPVYRAKADVLELNVDFDITDDLTLFSQIAWVKDQTYSFQDYNRFNTEPIFTDTSQLTGNGGGETLPDGRSVWVNLAPGGVFCDPQLGCSNTLAGFDIAQAKAEQFSQEIRLQSDYQGPFNFSVGANYTKFDVLIDYYVFYNLITAYALMKPFYQPTGGGAIDLTVCPASGFTGDGPEVPAGDPTALCPYVDPNPIESINGEGHNYFRSKNPYKLKSAALFGEAYWNLSDDLKITAGLRYTDDKKEFVQVPSQVLLAGGIAAGGTVSRGYPERGVIKQHWGEFSGRLGVDWKPDFSFTDDTMLYAFYSRGYKGGGANPPTPGFATEADERAQWLAQGLPEFFFDMYVALGAIPVLKLTGVEYGETFDPEFVDAFEIGAKNTLLGGALTLNANAFYYDYKDYQVSQIRDRSAVNENFDATTWGVELQSVFAPSRDFQIIANIGYLDTRIADGETSIDIMNRTQGDPNYIVAKPWPQLPSNCVVPTAVAESYLQNSTGVFEYFNLCGGVGGIFSLFLPNKPIDPNPEFGGGLLPYDYRNYPELNGGAGLKAQLGGNELPNAPHWTTNIGAQYGIDMLDGWRATVRGDAYWQSQSWARVYNLDPYDKLHGWYNVNLSVWFEKPDQDLKIELYAKNLLDKTPITDAFLNSDDTALTTNVFVLDPRLIGLSIKKGF